MCSAFAAEPLLWLPLNSAASNAGDDGSGSSQVCRSAAQAGGWYHCSQVVWRDPSAAAGGAAEGGERRSIGGEAGMVRMAGAGAKGLKGVKDREQGQAAAGDVDGGVAGVLEWVHAQAHALGLGAGSLEQGQVQAEQHGYQGQGQAGQGWQGRQWQGKGRGAKKRARSEGAGHDRGCVRRGGEVCPVDDVQAASGLSGLQALLLQLPRVLCAYYPASLERFFLEQLRSYGCVAEAVEAVGDSGTGVEAREAQPGGGQLGARQVQPKLEAISASFMAYAPDTLGSGSAGLIAAAPSLQQMCDALAAVSELTSCGVAGDGETVAGAASLQSATAAAGAAAAEGGGGQGAAVVLAAEGMQPERWERARTLVSVSCVREIGRAHV